MSKIKRSITLTLTCSVQTCATDAEGLNLGGTLFEDIKNHLRLRLRELHHNRGSPNAWKRDRGEVRATQSLHIDWKDEIRSGHLTYLGDQPGECGQGVIRSTRKYYTPLKFAHAEPKYYVPEVRLIIGFSPCFTF